MNRIIIIGISLILTGLLLAGCFPKKGNQSQVSNPSGRGAVTGLEVQEGPGGALSYDELVQVVWERLEPEADQLESEQELRDRVGEIIEELREEGKIAKERIDKEDLITQLIDSLREQGKLRDLPDEE